MIERAWKEWDECSPWKLGVFGFALWWWLLLVPCATGVLWPLLTGASVPGALDRLLPLSYVLLAIGAMFSLNALSGLDDKKTRRTRLVARWFVLGVSSMILAGTLGLMPAGIF